MTEQRSVDGQAVPLVIADQIVKEYGGRRRRPGVRAVDGVSLCINQGETVGLVGESGSGKSTLARAMVRLESPTSGRLLFDGEDITDLSDRAMRARRREMQMVFQDPVASLNRRRRVADIIAAPLRIYGERSREARRARVRELLDLVGLERTYSSAYPTALSGGQAQRVGIARALALSPRFVVLDEAVSAVDVSTRAQILNLLRDLQRSLGLTYLFISHDLSVVRYMADHVAVMYMGRVVESAPRASFFSAPRHPYTHTLMSAIPAVDRPAADRRDVLPLDSEPGIGPSGGCRFEPRCPVGRGRELCKTVDPQLAVLQDSHLAACHFPPTYAEFAAAALTRKADTGPADSATDSMARRPSAEISR